MASSRQEFSVWQDENKENVIPENGKTLKRSASASDSLSLFRTENRKSNVQAERKITGVREVFNENYDNNVRTRHLSLTGKALKRSYENVEFVVKRRLRSYDCKSNVESRCGTNEEITLAEENENVNKNHSCGSTSKSGARMKIDKVKLRLHAKSTPLESTGSENNWRKLYHPRILTIRQNEGTVTPVDLSIPPFLEKVKELRKRNTKDVSVEATTDRLKLAANGKPVISKVSCDLEDADEYIEMQIEREKSRRIVTNLENPFIASSQRKIIVDFLTRVNTYRGDPPFILYQTVKILDAAVKAMKIDIEDLQVTALAAMWISIKRDNVNIPSATSMIAFGGDELKEKANVLQKFECRILRALNFDISYPDVSSILAHFIFIRYGMSNDNPRIDITYDCGNFFIDIAIRDASLCTVSAVLLAGVAAIVALFLVESPNDCLMAYFEYNFSRLPYANRFLYGEALFVRRILTQRALDWRHKYERGSTSFKKYARKRYNKIKEFLFENINKLDSY